VTPCVRVKDLLETREMACSSKPHTWPQGDPITLPETYTFEGAARSTEEFMTDTDTAAVLVLIDGVVRYERYTLTGGPDVQWLSMSVAKSVISALGGIAVAEGHIASIDDPISAHVPVRPGSAYDGVSAGRRRSRRSQPQPRPIRPLPRLSQITPTG
jgi:hypothetical protein